MRLFWITRMSNIQKSVFATPFHDHAQMRHRRWYWLAPVFVLFLYACVMGAFFWMQQLQSDSVMFVTIDQETRQHSSWKPSGATDHGSPPACMYPPCVSPTAPRLAG